MNSRNILMVTTSFPYGQGEAFVSAELAHLAEIFASVTLVPCFFTQNQPPREICQSVEIGYAEARWGSARIIHVVTSFFRASWRYNWLKDAVYVLGRKHRLENLKELVRCLYRAQLFEQFLEQQYDAGKRYDMIYFYWIVPEIAGALSFKTSFRNGKFSEQKVVARAHGGDLYEERRPGGYAGLTGTIIAGLDAVFCISEHGRKYLEQKYPALIARFHLARLGVNDPGFINPQPDEGMLSILSCSFMVSGKRLHLIVDAIAVIVAENPSLKIRWTHIGDGELFHQLQSYAEQKFDRCSVVVLFKGYMMQPEVVAFYRTMAFDVIINVSDTEGIPVSLMEASSTGIPMVATDVGGSGEIVNAANGILIHESASASTIAKALLFFTDKQGAIIFRKRAREFWSMHFNAKRNYTRFGEALHKTMDSV